MPEESIRIAQAYTGSILCFSAPFTVAAVVLVAFLRGGSSVKDYLAIRGFTFRHLLMWLGITAALVVVESFVAYLLRIDAHAEWMLDLVRTAKNPALLILGVTVAGPLFEETLFRGLIFKGVAESEAGPMTAVILTSILWAFVHTQYGWYAKFSIFSMGIVFGLARWKSESVMLPLVLHILVNFVVMVEMAMSA